MSKRQLVIMAADPSGEGESPSLGTRREILARLEDFNTWPDVPGGEFLYGPGLTMQVPPVDDGDDVTQLLVAVVEEDIAWPVLTRICEATHWALVDLESGRSLAFA